MKLDYSEKQAKVAEKWEVLCGVVTKVADEGKLSIHGDVGSQNKDTPGVLVLGW